MPTLLPKSGAGCGQGKPILWTVDAVLFRCTETLPIKGFGMKGRAKRITEAFLRRYCETEFDAPSYGALYQGAVNSLQYGVQDYITISGQDAHGGVPVDVVRALRIVMVDAGHDVPESWGPEYYSCSC